MYLMNHLLNRYFVSSFSAGDWMSKYVYFGLYVGLAIMDIVVILLACLALWAEVRVSVHIFISGHVNQGPT